MYFELQQYQIIRKQPMNEQPNVADYVGGRLAREGITDCFGVAGDFAFRLCDAVGRNRRPALRVRAVDGATVVDIINAETLFDEEDISHLADQLRRLAEDGHTRLVLNFHGVHTMSSDVLGMLAALHRRLEKSGRRLAISGLEPVLSDMLRICRLEEFFDLAEASEALGAAARSDIPGA
jgi:anti-anti-sigma factor